MRRARVGGLLGFAVLIAAAVAVPQAGQSAAAPAAAPPAAASSTPPGPKVIKAKEAASADVQSMYDLGQQMIDSVFSFGELGFQESKPRSI